MKLHRVTTPRERRRFYAVPQQVYRDNPCHRATEESLTHLLVDGPTAYHRHAEVVPYLLCDDDRVVGRCALIHDEQLPEYVQVAFFEAQPGVHQVCETLCAEARAFRPQARKIVAGLNGHLNYGAGFLLDRFDEPPIFGLPYTPPYYQDYFAGLTLRGMLSFRFPVNDFFTWAQAHANDDTGGITARFMRMRDLRNEVEHYTRIDNNSFEETPYWSKRLPQENYELFHPFRFLMKGENLVFAEKNGKPMGFLLWYPDFNALVGSGRELGIREALRYRLANPVKTFRFTEIALLPDIRFSKAVLAMILKLTPIIAREGYEYCEGGFIFENNRASLNMTQRFIERALGRNVPSYRRYGVFEGGL